MGRYAIRPGTLSGARVIELESGHTAVASNRTLDNMSPAAAEEALELLERRDALRREHIEGAQARNDLVAILDNASKGN